MVIFRFKMKSLNSSKKNSPNYFRDVLIMLTKPYSDLIEQLKLNFNLIVLDSEHNTNYNVPIIEVIVL